MASEADIADRPMQAAAAWHASWAVALGLAAVAWLGAGQTAAATALAIAAAPGLVGQLLRWRSGGAVRVVLVLSWPIATAAALALSGGVSGPLAALALAPAAAMTALDGRRLIALGAALGVASIAAVALADAAGLALGFAAPAPWLSLIALGSVVVGLAAALLMARARAAEREAEQSDEAARLRGLLEAEPLLLVRLDAAGVAREVFCGAADDQDAALIGQPFENLACEAHRGAARAALALVRRGGEASVGFAPPLAPDRWLAVELRALADGGAIALIRDASRERAYEAHLEQARDEAQGLAAAKSRFLANMSHELRTPLNAVIGFSDIMRSRLFGPMPERYSEYAALIHESGGHLLDLINDVLDMSKIEAERFELAREEFDAREAVAAALRLTRVQADQARIAMRGALPPEPLEVDADRRALKQIVLNLVSNALKFTPAGGQVNVVARRRGGELELIVADTGVGIAPADLARLGRPYEQAGAADQRALGAGLGLSLSRALAELHGGRLSIDSVVGEGTVVSVRLPVLAPAPARAPPAPESRPVALGENVVAFKPQR